MTAYYDEFDEPRETPKQIAEGLSWIESFTMRHIISGRIIPWAAFELTSSEISAIRKLSEKGLAEKGWIGWRATPLGKQVRAALKDRKP